MVEPPGTPDGRAAAAAAATLLVKHIPNTVQPETLQRLLAHYGAVVVRPCSVGRLKNCAYVDFADEAAAVRAQAQLHRLRLLNKTLWVGRAPEIEPKAELADGGSAAKAVSPYPASSTELRSTASFNLRPVLRGPAPVPTVLPGSYAAKPPPPGEPIAPSLGVDYPFPPDLEFVPCSLPHLGLSPWYAYPPPDSNILSNITSALIAVLHLMNKMNLPAPFRPAVPTPPFPSAAPPPAPPSSPPLTAQAAPELSDGESELESDEEVRVEVGEDALTSGIKPRKKARVSVTSLPPLKDVAKPTSVIKKNAPVIQIKLGSKLAPAQRPGAGEETRDARKQISGLAVNEEIQKSKLSPEEILAMPMFKNYSVGEPSDVLYVKNLAKDVTQEDLLHIYGKHQDEPLTAKSMLLAGLISSYTSMSSAEVCDLTQAWLTARTQCGGAGPFVGLEETAKRKLGVKLMQEGRMRGQAFVTFPALNLAQKALVATHGYLLKDKPMVVQYGRKPVTRESDEGKK
eukprot:SM000011S19044  [mRNA]  locus=s11:550035:553810:- [translate_table: standard]